MPICECWTLVQFGVPPYFLFFVLFTPGVWRYPGGPFFFNEFIVLADNSLGSKSQVRLFYIVIFLSFELSAATLDYKGQKFNLEIPKNWLVNKDLFGLPVAIVGPKVGTSRIVIGVIPTNKSFDFLNKAELRRSVNKYYEGRRRWVKKYKGKVEKLYSLATLKDQAGNNIYKIGYRYSVTGTIHEEYTYYFNCRGKLFNLKSLRNLKNFPNFDKQIDDTIRSFQCK